MNNIKESRLIRPNRKKVYSPLVRKLTFIVVRRCELLESMGAHNELLQACLTMLRGVQPDTRDGLEWVKLAEHIACIHYGQGNYSSARRALSNALFKCSAYFTMENYHLLLELQIITKHYIGVIKVCSIPIAVDFPRKRKRTIS